MRQAITAHKVTDPHEIARLRYELSVELHKHNLALLNKNGIDDDEFYRVSDLYGAYNEDGEIVGGCRLIHWVDLPPPTLTFGPLYPEAQTRIASLNPHRVAEISRLISIKGRKNSQNFAVTTALYQAMWKDVVTNNHLDYWLAFTMPRLYKRLERLHINFDKLGDPLPDPKYPDRAIRQCGLLDLRGTYLRLKTDNPNFLALFVNGLDEEALEKYDRHCANSLCIPT